MRSAFSTALGLSMTLLLACTTYDSSLLVDAPEAGGAGASGATSAGSGGAGSGGAATAGSSGAGAGGSSAGAGGSSAGAGGSSAGAGGSSGGAGNSGSAGAGGSTAGAGGSSAGAGGSSSGAGGAAAGAGGSSGGAGGSTAGTGGATAGAGGSSGGAGGSTAGAGGSSAGAGGSSAGAGGSSGGAGNSGSAGAGGKGCIGASDCDDANACTTDSCDAAVCKHVALPDDTATPGVTPDPGDCKASVCKAGKVALVPAPSETGDDGNACTSDSCGLTGVPQHTPLHGVIACDAGAPEKVCVTGVCKANSCGDGVLAGGEQCDGADLGGQTCQGLGYASAGVLACAPTTCKYLTLGCLSPGDLVITEVLYDAASGVNEPAGEWIELYNASAKPVDLLDLRVARDTSVNTHVVSKSIVVPPGGYVVLGSSTDTSVNGGAPVAYEWGNEIQLSNTGTHTITIGVGALELDKLTYAASASYTGKSYSLKAGLLTAAANDVAGNFCAGKTPYGAGGLGTPGAANDCP